MTKNDITRGLIDFAVSQCLKNIKEDPYRSIRRLADLGPVSYTHLHSGKSL